MSYSDFNSICKKCNLWETATKQCLPKGTDEPYIYFVGEAPGPDEDYQGIPFVGRAGKMLHDILGGKAINENNCRFFNVCRCMPATFDDDGKKGFRAPSQDEMNACIGFLDYDIRATDPKVIVALGSTAMRALIPDIQETITKARGELYTYKNYTVIPTYHPSYLMRNPNNNKIRSEFISDIDKAMDIASGKIDGVRKDNASVTTMCKTFVEFNDFCKKYIDGSSRVAYDVETNAKEVHSEDHRVVGFSLASSKDHGCYAPLQSVDFTMSDSDKRMIEKRLTKILMSKNVTVYNCQHEWPVTLNWLNIEMPDVDDVFVMVKLMMGNADKYQGNGGLKVQCEENLNYKDWSEDVDKYFEYLWKYEENKDNMTRLLLKYYPSDSDIFSKVENIALNVIPNIVWDKDHPISYEYIPHLLVGRYGSIDSSVLFELRDFYEDKMRVESDRLGVDLFKGYEYWMDHHYAGYTLELNGAYWNDEKAQKVEDWCNNGMVTSLRNLLMSPLSEKTMKDSLHEDFLYYLKDKYMDYVLEGSYIPKKTTKNTISVTCVTKEAEDFLKTMSLEPKYNKKGMNTGVYSLYIGNFETICNRKMGQARLDIIFDRFYRDYMKEFFSKDQTVESMKKLLNPTSTSKQWKEFMSSVLIYDDIRIAKKYFGLLTIIEDPSYDIDLYKFFYNYDTDTYQDADKYQRDFNFKEYKASHPEIQYQDSNDSKLLSFVHKLSTSDTENRVKFEMFKKFINETMAGKNYSQRKVKKTIRDANDYKLETLDKSVMIDLFSYYELVGVNIEDRSTWTDRFEWLYNYQAYKKYAKMISTYIQGKVGRQSVYYVNRESYSRGDKLSRRHGSYFDTENPDPNDCCVLQTVFRVNMADSGRWKATMHTMPSTETGGNIKGIVTSRFKGGVIAMPDCSQAEVRVLAAQSGDENLIHAFQDEGMDIHKFVASLIWHHGDISKVTKLERKIAKSSVFGILYGKSLKSFADENFHGELEEAKKVYDYFYTSFPKIKDYVDGSHEMYDKWKKVVLSITGRFIDYSRMAEENGSDTDRVYRQCQNGIIQGETCDLAGMILYNICKFVKDNNLKSKPFCFIHDSIELDLHPDETFMMLDKLSPLFNEYPWEKFKVPMASDIVFSSNMGSEIDCVELLHDDDYNDVTITMKGFKNDIDEVIDGWKSVYDLVEKDETFESPEPVEVKVPMRCMFQEKVEITPKMGTSIYVVSERYHIVRHLN